MATDEEDALADEAYAAPVDAALSSVTVQSTEKPALRMSWAVFPNWLIR
jgi:hypothetical protein